MPELIYKQEALDKLKYMYLLIERDRGQGSEVAKGLRKACRAISDIKAVDTESVRHGRWIECDYKHIEHGMIETEPKAGLCCSDCRTAFQKKKMTYKQYCAACGARMDLRTPTEVQLDEADSEEKLRLFLMAGHEGGEHR